jgi:hypothetical protein
VCLEGGYDPDSRRCMPWERTLPGSAFPGDEFRNRLSELIRLKKADGMISGKIRVCEQDDLLILARDKVTLVINMSGRDKNLPADGKLLNIASDKKRRKETYPHAGAFICSNLVDAKNGIIHNKGYAIMVTQ